MQDQPPAPEGERPTTIQEIAEGNTFNMEVMLSRLMNRVHLAVPDDPNIPLGADLGDLLQRVGVLSQATAMRAQAMKAAPPTNIFASGTGPGGPPRPPLGNFPKRH